ncbi:Choline-sulfatase [Planctomycetes bacterium CA13]|uniref:Choline-sulfatase n=1 Tax=Novipirellula herctigrandis TaxID=2527986 RepID=A0A5C5Z610_9BACT|nr:Choline-sulfatase [Planctomycetes bacterium CA13]
MAKIARIVTAILMLAGAAAAAGKPNIVVFLADDHGWADSSVYGSSCAKTPNLQSLADRGMVLDRAFVASPACGPSRAALLSGLMPARNGAEPNHTMPHDGALTMVNRLQQQGYEVVAFGKVGHGRETEMAGFDHSRDYPKQRDRDGIKGLVQNFFANRQSDKPLCLMVGDHRPHVAWIKESSYDPNQVVLPVASVDTKETREHWARYLADVTGMDAMVGEVDRMAQDYFKGDDFLFLYSADHGAQWPFGKWNLYDSGIRTPLIVRWPGHVKPNVRTDAMVSWVDVMPTLVDIAGGTVPSHIDGRSFTQVLFGKRSDHRDVIFSTHSGDGNRNVYPIRAVRTEKYKYIRNLRPDCYHSNHSDIDRKDGAGAYWDSWDEAAKNDPKAAAIVGKYYVRPGIEFYDLDSDPHEQVNLAEDPKQAATIAEMSSMLDDWMKTQGDTQRVFNKPYPVTGPKPVDVAPKPRQRPKKIKG